MQYQISQYSKNEPKEDNHIDPIIPSYPPPPQNATSPRKHLFFRMMVVHNPWKIRPPVSWGAFRGSIACQEGGMKSLTKGISRLDLIAWPPVDCIFQDCTFLGGFKSCHTVQIPKLIFAVVSWIFYIILWYQKWGSSSGLQTKNIYAAFWRSIRVEVLRP